MARSGFLRLIPPQCWLSASSQRGKLEARPGLSLQYREVDAASRGVLHGRIDQRAVRPGRSETAPHARSRLTYW